MQITNGLFTEKHWADSTNNGAIGKMSYPVCIKRMNGLNSRDFNQERRFIQVCGNVFNDSFIFYRNYPLFGTYFGDFVCFKRKIVIEINERHHLNPDQRKRDAIRLQKIKDAGFMVLNLWQDDSEYQWRQKTIAFLGRCLTRKNQDKKSFKASRKALLSKKNRKNYNQLMAAARRRDKDRREKLNSRTVKEGDQL